MHIEIWSDYACPFCFIGKHRLEQALTSFTKKDHVTIEFKSFQLDPEAPLYKGEDYYESLAKKFGTVDRVKQMTENVQKFAESVNLSFNFAHVKPTNTYHAHRLGKFALTKNKNTAMTEALFRAHFIEAKDIGDIDTLVTIAGTVGLDQAEVRKMLKDHSSFADDVTLDLQEARQFNITGVPFFVFNRRLALSGAQENEVFQQALEEAWENKQE